jgi:hypothetical protein
MPVPIPEVEHGNLYEGDCYIALDNHEDPGEWGKRVAESCVRFFSTSFGVCGALRLIRTIDVPPVYATSWRYQIRDLLLDRKAI